MNQSCVKLKEGESMLGCGRVSSIFRSTNEMDDQLTVASSS